MHGASMRHGLVMEPVKLGAWIVTPTGLVGVRLADGKQLRTSPILQAQGRLVQTLNTRYELVGEPAQAWVGYCALQGITIDMADPVRQWLRNIQIGGG